MREISCNAIISSIKEMCIQATHYLSDDMKSALYKGVEKELPAPSIAPHQKGLLVIPAEAWEEGELLSICFYTATGELLDAEQVSLGSDYHVRLADSEASPVNGVLLVEETVGMMTIKGDGFEIPFSKETGLISKATS